MATNMPLLSFTKDNKDCSESNGYISTPFKETLFIYVGNFILRVNNATLH